MMLCWYVSPFPSEACRERARVLVDYCFCTNGVMVGNEKGEKPSMMSKESLWKWPWRIVAMMAGRMRIGWLWEEHMCLRV